MSAVDRTNGFSCRVIRSTPRGVYVRYTTGYMTGHRARVQAKDLFFVG